MSTFLKVADVKQGPSEMPADPPIDYKFPLDPFQQHAMKAICLEENVLVTAKTGSGKTLVGEVEISSRVMEFLIYDICVYFQQKNLHREVCRKQFVCQHCYKCDTDV